ncbi:hypothetical protein Naga_100020g31 [Nannochloropsis gaditana]|uniref:Uncharacterized protein n=1 Tax=Nannochloropsis gaditana TaxID=72520 RepID=W7TD81_9STRA|nr:hypothetical protein Naga_100020g31 [Nannochloropsis gaditana]
MVIYYRGALTRFITLSVLSSSIQSSMASTASINISSSTLRSDLLNWPTEPVWRRRIWPMSNATSSTTTSTDETGSLK